MGKRKYKLNPCPNCGGEKILTWNICFTRKYYCECEKCYWCGETKYFAFRAARAWNRQKAKTSSLLKKQAERNVKQ